MTQFAFVFPGQGSQAIAMLDGFAGNRVVADTVAEASDALQFDLGKLIAEGPKEELDLTTNTQPVMLTAAVAFYRACEWLKGQKIVTFASLEALAQDASKHVGATVNETDMKLVMTTLTRS